MDIESDDPSEKSWGGGGVVLGPFYLGGARGVLMKN